MPDAFDVIVIGAGPAGEVVAGRCADGGLSTAIVEAELVGGECSYWGCMPSKALIRPGDVLAAARRVPGAAEAVSGPLDVAAALARRDAMTSGWKDDGQLPWLEERGVTLIRGRARLTGERAVAVDSGGAVTTYEAVKAVVVATGSEAVRPPIDGLMDAEPWDNRDATAAQAIPERLIVLGGGAIGVEMAQTFRRLGSASVTVIEGAPRLLFREEPFAGADVAEAFAAEGIAVITGAKVVSVHRDAGGVTATLDDGRTCAGDEILVAVGRRPRTADLGLDAVGLGALSGKALATDDRLRVEGGGGWLYAIGDCNGLALLTHMGKYQARVCADVILGKQARDVADAGVVPRVTFSDPQVCAVGYTEADARAAGITVRTVSVATGDVSGAAVSGRHIAGTCMLVVDEPARVIVGATFMGPGIQELLHSATVAIAGRVPLDVLWHAVPSFPTVSEVWLKLLEAYGL